MSLIRRLLSLAAVLAASGCNSEAEADAAAPRSDPDASKSVVVEAEERRSRANTSDASAAPKAARAPESARDCEEIMGVASAPLNSKAPIELNAGSQLHGEGLALTLMPQQNVVGSLRWRGDRLFLTVDQGFWEIPPEGKPTFYSTSSVILWGLRAGDLDNDGDQDLIVLTLVPNEGNAPTPFGSQLAVWERSSRGLSLRTVILLELTV